MKRFLSYLTTIASFLPLLAARAYAANEGCEPNDPLCVPLTEPLGDASKITGPSGQDILANYVATIYLWASSIIGVICVVIIIYSGIEIGAAGGDEQAVSKAKTRIFESLSGLAVLLLSGVILYLVNPNFFTRS